jgi:hypothetical protein
MVDFTDYIKAVQWKTSKDGSHQYTIWKWKPELIVTFRLFVREIKQSGYVERWGGRDWTYLNIGEYKYWTADPIPENELLINRCKINQNEKL